MAMSVIITRKQDTKVFFNHTAMGDPVVQFSAISSMNCVRAVSQTSPCTGTLLRASQPDALYSTPATPWGQVGGVHLSLDSAAVLKCARLVPQDGNECYVEASVP